MGYFHQYYWFFGIIGFLVFVLNYWFFGIIAILPILLELLVNRSFTNIIGIIGISNNLAIILVNIGPMPEMTNNIGKIIGNTNNTNNIGKTAI